MVTVEAAIAMGALVVVLLMCLGALLAASMQVRCVDAAREAARLSARGDDAHAQSTALRIAPGGASVEVSRDGQLVVVRVRASSPLLPLVDISAEAVAAMEPGAGEVPDG